MATQRLAAPTAFAPIMFGAPAPPGDLLSWNWAERRLREAEHYWIATTRPGGRPHCRPVWGVWLDDGFWFSTGSLAARNLESSDQITVHLEGGREVVIVEGTARPESDPDSLQTMCDAYGPKYDHPISPYEDGTVRDSSGTGGPAYLVIPHVVFGWDENMSSPTRWTF
ncbi:pyridoxamine 5'-phosphate oxidase family protein [Actinomadura adrarensis]|uniref:Pyridoxamine 5'-phosphate oxidase family protein n=1 Tax=Actinomadura adrarensis TaxID=1819600 RepID=A0ABW3CMS0_9ACTN